MHNSILLLLLLAPFQVQHPAYDPIPAAKAAGIAVEVNDFVNEYRRQKRLQPLQRNASLDAIAQEHANRMASGKVGFSHAGFDGRAARARKATRVTTVGENLFWTTDEDQVGRQAVDGWIHSPGHNRNLLGKFRLNGIGIATGADGSYFVVQIYGG